MKTDRLYRRAIRVFGTGAQLTKTIEEIGEFLAALGRHGNEGTAETLDAVIDEIADVLIVMGQLRLIFGAEAVDARMAFKLERLLKRLDEREQK